MPTNLTATPGADFQAPIALATLSHGAMPERIKALSGAVPRNKATAPVAPSPTPQDTQLFEDAANPSLKFWLPRYHLGEELVSGQTRYRIGFSDTDGTWRLALRLETLPASALAATASQHSALPHDIEVILSYTVQGARASRKSLLFQEVIRDEDGADVALVLSGMPQRDEVFAVLQDPARGATLIVNRKARLMIPEAQETARTEASAVNPQVLTARVRAIDPRIAVAVRPLKPAVRPTGPVIRPTGPIVRPTGPVIAQPTPALVKPIVVFNGSERVDIRGRKFDRYNLGVKNSKSFHPSLFAGAPQLPPCGANKNASRTWLDILDGKTGARLYGYCAFSSPGNLRNFSLTIPAGTAPPSSVRISLTDRQTRKRVLSDPVKITQLAPPEPQFILIEAEMEQAVSPEPFAFSADLHGYIFDGLSSGGNGTPGQPPTSGVLRRRQEFAGNVHSYFQDATERNVFFYLPDDFRISRRGGALRSPFMTLRVRSNGGSTTNTDVTLDYAVAPYTDPARLTDARTALAAQTSQDAEAIVLQAFVTSEVRFTIHRPTEAGRVTEERLGGALMLQSTVFDTLSIPVADFQIAFDAMLGRTASVFGGQVDIEIEGWETESLPFVADFRRLAGPVVDVALGSGGATLAVSVTNAIESPLLLDDLALSATRAGVAVPINLSDQITNGMQLATGETLDLTTSIPVVFSLVRATLQVTTAPRIELDDAAILDSILDRSTLEYYREVEIHAIAAVFAVPADRPHDQIHTILVEFEGGATVALNEATQKVIARVDYPFDEVILRRVRPDSTYRYTKTVIRVNGRQDRDPEPLTSSSNILFLSVFP
ncbi:hypothetical protein [Roseovarius sp. M141]|uniref:hypothetical protein n=1 Tax=Roseovarius sp. M141 TaxID=2583806 RepID=UPI0020CF42C3|nr:hypothetical protein [Roseovarius sp. M141]MCQ0092523.1 hypothetical protein [Roseovarius sp. M141]